MLKNHSSFNLQGIKAILLMGGSGSRFGSDLPKQFHRLAGKKIYLHTLEAFLSTGFFEEIILVCPLSWMEEVKQDLLPYPSHVLHIVEGGTTRQESSLKGLLACGSTTQIAVIHDAVRPFVSSEILKNNIESALAYGAADTCIPSADTLVYAPHKNRIDKIPSRSEYMRGQTPQSFNYSLILNAHLQAQKEQIQNSSDDCSLALRLGHPIHIVEGSEENIKITSELDLFLAEQLFRLKHRCISSKTESSLKNKKIAVTGGTGGIGQALCRLLEQEGAIPLCISRSSASYSADLTSFSETKKIFDKIQQDHGPIDALVNSIGLLKTQQTDQLSNEDIDQLISTNLNSVIYSCKCAHLKPNGHIINIASSSYVRGRKDFAVYSCAKAAVVNFTQGFAEERPHLYINALVPQRTLTAMRTHNFPDEDPSTLLTPADVAAEILSLLKQQSLTATIVEVRKKSFYPLRQNLNAKEV